MPKTKPFDENSTEYDKWYMENHYTYTSELNAIRSLIPQSLQGVEIGIGTGRFSENLDIMIGVEPSHPMAEIARRRGIEVLEGIAEKLPLADSSFDFALMVTAICFFDDVEKAFREAYRIIGSEGFLVVAFIDKESKVNTE